MQMLYLEPSIIGGKKRIKLIVFSVIFCTLMLFFVIFHIFFSIFSLKSHFITQLQFYCVAISSPTDDTKTYTSRGAGAVMMENHLALALFSTLDQAESVVDNLDEDAVCLTILTPKLSLEGLNEDEAKLAQKIYSYYTSSLTQLCNQTILFDSEKITEQNFRVSIGSTLLDLTKFHSSLPSNHSPTLLNYYSLLSFLISELEYLLTTSNYTENLTPYISLIRSVTLNLLFSFTP